MKHLLQTIATRHPYAMATVLFIAVMTFSKLGVEKIVTNYGLTGSLLVIATAIGVACLMERRS